MLKRIFFFAGITVSCYGTIASIVKLFIHVPQSTELCLAFLGLALVGIGIIIKNQETIFKILKKNGNK